MQGTEATLFLLLKKPGFPVPLYRASLGSSQHASVARRKEAYPCQEGFRWCCFRPLPSSFLETDNPVPDPFDKAREGREGGGPCQEVLRGAHLPGLVTACLATPGQPVWPHLDSLSGHTWTALSGHTWTACLATPGQFWLFMQAVLKRFKIQLLDAPGWLRFSGGPLGSWRDLRRSA